MAVGVPVTNLIRSNKRILSRNYALNNSLYIRHGIRISIVDIDANLAESLQGLGTDSANHNAASRPPDCWMNSKYK